MQVKFDLPLPLIGELKKQAKKKNVALEKYITAVLVTWHFHVLDKRAKKEMKK